MKAVLFEKYYKLGFSHFVFKKVLGLKKPSSLLRWFYLGVMTLIAVLAQIFGW